MERIESTIIETYYQIEWLVPESQAIGGKSFWYIIYDGQHHTDEQMMKMFRNAQKNHDEGTIRLVEIQKRWISA